jgi:AhpD family alkylhydroperoxidase
MESWEQFARQREELNRKVLQSADRVTKRFFSLDALTYRDGALPAATKELLGLVASLVLRCDDCVAYHLGRCRDLGHTREQVSEALGVAMVVGGSITIPHVRRAVALWGELAEKESESDREER